MKQLLFGMILLAGCSQPEGVAGPKGETGAAGAIGPAGAVGPAGATGPAGAVGPAGATGPAGAAGSDGAAGTPGAPGAAGPAGFSPVVQAVSADGGCVNGGASITSADGGIELVCNGAAGAPGAQGLQGTAGIQGIQGAAGPQGIQGVQGAAGPGGLLSFCGVNGIGTAAITDVGCGEVVTFPRAMRCSVTATAYVAPSAIGPTTTLAVTQRIANVNSVFGGSGGANHSFWPAAQVGAVTTSNTFTAWANVASGTSINFGCRAANLTAAVSVACNVSWICF